MVDDIKQAGDLLGGLSGTGTEDSTEGEVPAPVVEADAQAPAVTLSDERAAEPKVLSGTAGSTGGHRSLARTSDPRAVRGLRCLQAADRFAGARHLRALRPLVKHFLPSAVRVEFCRSNQS